MCYFSNLIKNNRYASGESTIVTIYLYNRLSRLFGKFLKNGSKNTIPALLNNILFRRAGMVFLLNLDHFHMANFRISGNHSVSLSPSVMLIGFIQGK